MNNHLISVIIPIYNCSLYINNLLFLLDNTLQQAEVIFIDDGSSDNSLELLQNYIFQGTLSIKIVHTSNKGPAAARNIGIKIASRKYISFIDCDDVFLKNHFDFLLKGIKGSQLSMVNFEYIDGEVHFKSKLSKTSKSFDKEEYLEYCLSNNEGGFLWNKLFVRDIIITNNLLFNEKIYIAEDLLFIIYYLDFVSVINYNSFATYFYVKKIDSITHKKITMRKITLIKCYREILCHLKGSNKDVVKLCYKRYLNIYRTIYLEVSQLCESLEKEKLIVMLNKERLYYNKLSKEYFRQFFDLKYFLINILFSHMFKIYVKMK